MNVIITGSTGLVGGAVIRECIANPVISHAFVLSRKKLPDRITGHPKVTVIMHGDFSTYPEEMLQKLSECEACIWAIGGRASQFPDLETFRKVSVDYTLNAAKAFMNHLVPKLPQNRRFRFVFCSGKYAEWDQEKSLKLMADTRHVKGQVEKKLCELAENRDNRLDVFCARPPGIVPSDINILGRLTGRLFDTIKAQDLAKALVHLALDGGKNQIVECDELMRIR